MIVPLKAEISALERHEGWQGDELEFLGQWSTPRYRVELTAYDTEKREVRKYSFWSMEDKTSGAGGYDGVGQIRHSGITLEDTRAMRRLRDEIDKVLEDEPQEPEMHICRNLDTTLTYCGRASAAAAAVNFSEFRRARGPFCADCYRWAVLADTKCAIREAFELGIVPAPTDNQVYKIVGALEKAGLFKGQAEGPRSRWDAFSDEEIADLASLISAADLEGWLSADSERLSAEVKAERDHRETRLP